MTAATAAVDHPVYWAGERPGHTIELSTVDGRLYVRYLSRGAEAGDPRPIFLTIGTHPVADALGALRSASREDGAIVRESDATGLVVSNRGAPQSVYFADAASNLQVEVYDPSAREALELAGSGRVAPIR